MKDNYFLMPSDIKLTGGVLKNDTASKLSYCSDLIANCVEVLILDKYYKLNPIEVVNLKNLKNYTNYNKIIQRYNNIFFNSRHRFINNNNPVYMGILNLTEDSFYDGGRFNTTDKAIKHAYKLLEEGADIIDIGAESTRPGSYPVNPGLEKEKLIPLIKRLKKDNILISCDTRNSSTMLEVLNEGVDIINDVSGLLYDKNTLAVLKNYDCLYVLMHTTGTPQNMQNNTNYYNPSCDIYDFFKKKILLLQSQGIELSRIIVDPGFGFGKKDEHNYQILNYLSIFLDLGLPILVGLSRKSMISRFIGQSPENGLSCSVALALNAYLKGAKILRVHEVKETKDAIDIYKKANTLE